MSVAVADSRVRQALAIARELEETNGSVNEYHQLVRLLGDELIYEPQHPEPSVAANVWRGLETVRSYLAIVNESEDALQTWGGIAYLLRAAADVAEREARNEAEAELMGRALA